MASNFAKLLELLGRGIIGPFGRLNNTAHNESHVLAINLIDPSSGDTGPHAWWRAMDPNLRVHPDTHPSV
jgi:hypothetical protein